MSPAPDARSAAAAARALPRGWWGTAILVALGLTYLLVNAIYVQPFLPPAGDGAILAGDLVTIGSGDAGLFGPRPPSQAPDAAGPAVVASVTPGSAAERKGLKQGDLLFAIATPPGDAPPLVDSDLASSNPLRRLRAWRATYWVGIDQPVALIAASGTGPQRQITLARQAAWQLDREAFQQWLGLRAGLFIQLTVYMVCAAVLLLLRPRDLTAQFAIAALVLAGISTGGPPLGAEAHLGALPGRVLTMLCWTSTPLAFIAVGLAVSYFPRKSDVLVRHPWLHLLPVIVVTPMLVTTALTGLFVSGVDALAPAALWDAAHPRLFFAVFGAGLGLNLAAMSDMVRRFKCDPDPNERRRIALSVATFVLGMLCFVVQSGVPTGLALLGRQFIWPWWLSLPLYVMTALPALGVTYAVAVHRVLSPRVAVRRSLQYALAQRTLAFAAVLPALLFVISLVRQRNRSIADIVGGQPLLYAALLAAVLMAFRFRDRARTWLDKRFFRAEYDARAILLSLAARVPFETDPRELTALVLTALDRALHPAVAAVIVSGLEPDRLVEVSALRGHVAPLPQNGPLATLLAWSDEPLELDPTDTRSPARRLPATELGWLATTRTTLMVPLVAKDRETRTLLGAIVLGEKKSEEPYSAEDRELLASLAAQVSLGLDVARLRKREPSPDAATALMATSAPGDAPVAECPECRTCYEAGTPTCATDGTALRPGALPRTVDTKYRVDRLLGTGGMGAVYVGHDMRLDRDVALKVVRADLLTNPDARARFRREAQLVARLEHPGVVVVYDYGTLASGAAFFVMEYVRGRDLRSIVRAGPQPWESVARLIAGIAEPIDAAHRLGILHRDLKPENIILPDSGTVVAKVLDFGVAKLFGEPSDETGAFVNTLTAVGQPVGTPAYMAPEQLSGGTMTARTDIYSLGVIAYELLTGELPFGRGSFVDIAMRQQQAPPAMSRQDIPDAVRGAVVEALSADPARRPESAQAFSERLRQA